MTMGVEPEEGKKEEEEEEKDEEEEKEEKEEKADEEEEEKGEKWEEGKMEEGRVADPDVEFPTNHLARLDEQLGRPKWVVPVRRDDDLERLLRASIALCKHGKEWNMCCVVQNSAILYSTAQYSVHFIQNNTVGRVLNA